MGIAIHLRILIAMGCLMIIAFIFEAIRRGKLKEKYSIIWLAAGLTIFVFGVWPDSLFLISRILQLHHLSVLSLVAFLFLLLIVLHFSVVISRLSDRTKALAQHIGLLELEIKNLKKK